ncbi:HAD family hydrolase [Chloroflexota bacterium]
MDLEGTLLQRVIHLDDGRVAPSAWTLLAERLGEKALQEEMATKDRWLNGKYRNYIEWMHDTIAIHHRHGLTLDIFQQMIDSVREMNGARNAVRVFHANNAVTAIVSGGFKALADRVQRIHRITHTIAACEYFFHPETGQLEHWNLLPSDYEGKARFIRLLMNDYNITKEEACFIGDAQNDVPAAKEVGLSIAFNAQPSLREVCTYTIDQATGKEDFTEVTSLIMNHCQNH